MPDLFKVKLFAKEPSGYKEEDYSEDKRYDNTAPTVIDSYLHAFMIINQTMVLVESILNLEERVNFGFNKRYSKECDDSDHNLHLACKLS